MVALTRSVNRPYRDVDLLSFPVAANTHIFAGAIVQLDTGLLIPAKSGSGGDEALRVIGVAEEGVDNNPGTAGQRSCLVRMAHNCLFRIATNVDITNANIGTIYDVLDDQTLQATATNAAPAGRLLIVESTRLGWFDLFDTFTRP